MLRGIEFWILTVVSLLVLALVVVNVGLVGANNRLQQEVNDRQLYIQQSLQLEGLYRDIVKALADLAVQNKDQRLRELLLSQGITLNVQEPPATPGRKK
jgi:predicted Holliday junction resolvase-like endonuclease